MTDLALKSARIMDFCHKSSRFVDFEYIMDRGFWNVPDLGS